MLRVLIVAFDGLQPAQVTRELTPRLCALARRGVTFARHHAVFPTVTRVNAASMVTGRHPGGHGLLGNTLVLPELDPARALPALEPTFRRLVERPDGRVLLTPTLGELLAPHGRRFVSVVGGTSGNAYVQHPRAAEVGGAVLQAEFSLPRPLHDAVRSRFGDWPPKRAPELARIARVGDVLLDFALPVLDPDVALVWFPEPDTSQHVAGVGAPEARQALGAADAELSRILDALGRRGMEPDVLVVSDHGYSTVAARVDVEAAVRAAGFPAGDRPGGVTVAANGGAVLFYAAGSDAGVVDRLTGWLAGEPWAGALVGRGSAPVPGLLPGDAAGVAGPRAADVVMSFRWDAGPGPDGSPGRSDAADGAPGLGTHGSGSPQELRCTLVAAGPSFREGLVSALPSGNVDLTPTVLRLLGLAPPPGLDGRVLVEALRGEPGDPGPARREVIEAARATARGPAVSRLVLDHVGRTRYVASLDGGGALPDP